MVDGEPKPPPMDDASSVAWELIGDDLRRRCTQDQGKYRRDDADEIELVVLANLDFKNRGRLMRVRSLPYQHLKAVCRGRGLPLTGSHRMLGLHLVATDRRRRAIFPDQFVDCAIGELPIRGARREHLLDDSRRDPMARSARYVQIDSEETSEQVQELFPYKDRTAMKALMELRSDEELEVVIRGRGLPASGTKLMRCIYLVLFPDRHSRHPDAKMDDAVQIPNYATNMAEEHSSQ
mgnify:CR=1 FL=1